MCFEAALLSCARVSDGQAFARGLHEVGRRDQAAAVYCALLQGGGADRAQQAELLCRCLDCWSPEAPGPPLSQADQADGSLLTKLAHFVNSQTTFSVNPTPLSTNHDRRYLHSLH